VPGDGTVPGDGIVITDLKSFLVLRNKTQVSRTKRRTISGENHGHCLATTPKAQAITKKNACNWKYFFKSFLYILKKEF
jgi:hypothetical protein